MEKYSIEVEEDIVEVHGYLSTTEAINLMNFFFVHGYINLTPGHQNSTLSLTKTDFVGKSKDRFEEEKKSDLEKQLESEKNIRMNSQQMLQDSESIYLQNVKEFNEKFCKVQEENHELKRKLKDFNISTHPDIRKIIDPIY